MNTNLEVIILNDIEGIDSRNVANVLGKNHKELLRSIHKYETVLLSAKLRSVDFLKGN